MSGILDYIAWRGDIPIAYDGLCEADGAVLARFSYIPFEYFRDPPEGFVSVAELAGEALSDGRLEREERWKLRDRELLEAMAESRRFGGLEAGRFVSRFDEKLQTQFSAITVRLAPERYFLAFRGTDNTIVGWKEDLNMSYLCPIPSQRSAVEYAEAAAGALPGQLILGGHSKGGNLAVYAGAFCGEAAQERIEAVFNFDGPGFFDNILESPGYRRVCPKIRTFVPQFSVVGMLLGRDEESRVVHSTENGLHQHDMYSWEILGRRFVYLGTITGGSKFVDSALKGWIAQMTPEQFEAFADAIYTVMADTNARTLHEMRENWFDSAKSFVRTFTGMDEETRRAVTESIKLLAINAGHEVKALGRREGTGERGVKYGESH